MTKLDPLAGRIPTAREKVFVNVMNRLGVAYFKRWWPEGGSKWNRRHVDSKSRDDIENIIRNADGYVQSHVRNIINEIILFLLLLAVNGLQLMGTIIRLSLFLACIHFIAYMIQCYNKIRAYAALVTFDDSKEITPSYEGKSFRAVINGAINLVLTSETFREVGPVFTDERLCHFYAQYLNLVFSDNIAGFYEQSFGINRTGDNMTIANREQFTQQLYVNFYREIVATSPVNIENDQILALRKKYHATIHTDKNQ